MPWSSQHNQALNDLLKWYHIPSKTYFRTFANASYSCIADGLLKRQDSIWHGCLCVSLTGKYQS